ncbi:GntR family transcriptional regulator [Youhaiella tibetensis]|uniref:FCD domain-containing protein n=1 Tax=Paradevosia tibetensis TaxID=1447062 RepID=A0A5B9DNN3_9HYPH|nr:FCD domain-containing protein [Youhaiella tibetensis]QEE20309.1 FCD domain-containing protein [Youhaiella tibetensis]GGF25284.1 GntR family transcriptional regulator [Youhaiella tibetensis]
MTTVLTASDIAKALAADVHEGELRAGDMFQSERELCMRFGVGRTVVREAMTILQGMKLVDHSKGKRPRVVSPTLTQVMDSASEAAQFFFLDNEGKAHLEQARLFLETSMVRYAVVHATNAQIAKMVSAIEEADAVLADGEAFRDADSRFHRALTEVPGNPIFVALHDTFVERLMKNRPVKDDVESHNRRSNNEHKEVVSAILSKDSDKAVEVMTRHLTRNYGVYFQQALGRVGALKAN